MYKDFYPLFLLTLGALFILELLIVVRKMKESPYPAHFRWRLLRIGIPLLLLAVVINAISNFTREKPLSENLFLPGAAILLMSLSWFGTWRKLRPELEAEKLRMQSENRLSKNVKPSFLWQGLLILLPVCLLAVVGVLSLRWDRDAAEQDAAKLARSLAEQFDSTLNLRSPSFLEYGRGLDLWNSQLRIDVGVLQSIPGFSQDAARHVAAWKQKYPELDPAKMPLKEVDFNAQGQPVSLGEVPSPVSPDWLLKLTDRQRDLWQAAQKAETAEDFPKATSFLEQFIATKPAIAARANAEFSLLRLRTGRLPPAEAAQEFLKATVYNNVESETGLPLNQLFLFHLLRLLPDQAGIPEKFSPTLGWLLYGWGQSILTPHLLSEVQRVAAVGDSKSIRLIQAVTQLREAEERTWPLVDRLQEKHPLATWGNRAFWLESSSGTFLAEMEQSKEKPGMTTDPIYTVCFYPKKFLENFLFDCVQSGNITPPSYAVMQAEIGEHELTLKQGEQFQPVAGAKTPIIAETVIRLDTHILSAPIKFRVLLSDAGLLYARQRQRAILFGALIAFAAGAAIVGFVSARRSFDRQIRLSEMKSNFVSSVSHELRAPIASVRLMAEGLERGKISAPEKQQEYFRFIGQECRRLSSLIENVLDFSRIEQGRKQYEFEPTDIVRLVQETVKLMEPYALEKNVNLSLHLVFPLPARNEGGEGQGEGRHQPVIDGRAIQQALVNLIDNAVKHSPSGATVQVGLDFDEMKSCLWVEDSGPGIPPQEYEKIFERFYRLGSELRRETQGIGIGLSIVKHIVEAHAGKVLVRSEIGKGSQFTIEIPMRNEDAAKLFSHG